MNTTVVGVLLFLSAGHALAFANCLEAMNVPGAVQIKYSDATGAHELYFDNRYYFPGDLPADADILVIRSDASFSCGGARIDALPGTVFSIREWNGQERVLLKTGELTVTIGRKTTTMDSSRKSFSFIPSNIRGPLPSEGFLKG